MAPTALTTETEAGSPVAPSRRRAVPPPLLAATVAATVLLAALLVALLVAAVARPGRGPAAPGQLGASGLPADLPTPLANLMGLTPLPGPKERGFSLVDQHGHRLSLSGFAGRTVVLEFMDPHCVDICPLVSQEFVDAYHDLGRNAAHVVFAAVNVNRYHAGVADVEAFTVAHGLSAIPSWHFFTGPLPELRAVWRAYGIYVHARGPNADIVHSSEIFFIDTHGREQYVASPTVDHTAAGTAYLPAGELVSWGHGIALLARSLA